MNWISKLPLDISLAMRRLPYEILKDLEEVRLTEGRPMLLYSGGKEYELITEKRRILTQAEIEQICNRLSDYSAYSCQEDLAAGFLTIEGGHRVGVCGRAVTEHGQVKSIKEISSLNIRICREWRGISDKLVPLLLDENGAFLHTVIVSPPKCGKTTLLRDFIRNLSDLGFRVGVVDERSEIAGITAGIRGFDLGRRTDVLDRCPKSAGILMLVRAMAPDIVATDEIGKEEDLDAVKTALCAGTGLLTTIHGTSRQDLLRSSMGDFVRKGGFQRILYLSSRPKIGTVAAITDGEGRSLQEGESTYKEVRNVIYSAPASVLRGKTG